VLRVRGGGKRACGVSVTGFKLRVPKPTKSLFAAAMRVANGEGKPGDAARVRREFPGRELVFAARVVVLRGLFHEDGAGWYA
jgi:hypothetical protein